MSLAAFGPWSLGACRGPADPCELALGSWETLGVDSPDPAAAELARSALAGARFAFVRAPTEHGPLREGQLRRTPPGASVGVDRAFRVLRRSERACVVSYREGAREVTLELTPVGAQQLRLSPAGAPYAQVLSRSTR